MMSKDRCLHPDCAKCKDLEREAKLQNEKEQLINDLNEKIPARWNESLAEHLIAKGWRKVKS